MAQTLPSQTFAKVAANFLVLAKKPILQFKTQSALTILDFGVDRFWVARPESSMGLVFDGLGLRWAWKSMGVEIVTIFSCPFAKPQGVPSQNLRWTIH
jgi:hypothetical protein